MAEEKKKKKAGPGPQGSPPAPTQSPGSTTAVHFPGTTSPVSLPVGATGPGLPSGINPLIAGSLNTPYWQQQLQQNPSSVLAAYSPPALNQLSQFYSGQNFGGSGPMANQTFMPAPQPAGLQPIAPGVPAGQTTGPGNQMGPGGTFMPAPQGMRPGGAIPEPLTPPNSGPAGMGPQGGKGAMPQVGPRNAQGQMQMGGKGGTPQMPQGGLGSGGLGGGTTPFGLPTGGPSANTYM